ncbi:MAG: BON domain-containing protein [Acidobacteriota bacterium]|nr:BON domain-containing protein [Acidobacteriota bacterium]
MAFDEEQHGRSRIVVQTPAAEREVVRTTRVRAPERRGVPAGVVAALVIGSVALVTVLFLFILNRQSNDTAVSTDTRTASAQATPLQQPVVIQQQPTPLPPPPVIVQQPAPTTSQPPVIVEQQPATVAPPPSAPVAVGKPGADDAGIQSEIDKRMSEDATLSTVGVTATVQNGKVTLIGTVDAQAIKDRIERLVKAIKGVKAVDNQIIVSGG